MELSVPVFQSNLVTMAAEPPQQTQTNSKIHKRVKRLSAVILRLEAGKFVSNRSLGRYLLPAELDDYLQLCDQQKSLRAQLKQKPQAIQHYAEILKRADFAHNQATAYSGQLDTDKARLFFHQAHVQYQQALETLIQAVESEPELQRWLDRPVSMAIPAQLLPELMPRIVDSSSRFKHQDHPLHLIEIAKSDLKLQAVRKARAELLANAIDA